MIKKLHYNLLTTFNQTNYNQLYLFLEGLPHSSDFYEK